MPHFLTVDQKRIRMKISQACLDRFKRNKMDFKRRFITVDETWIHHFTPETKEQSKQKAELVEVHQRRQKQFNRLVRSWHRFSGITKEFYLSIKKVKQ